MNPSLKTTTSFVSVIYILVIYILSHDQPFSYLSTYLSTSLVREQTILGWLWILPKERSEVFRTWKWHFTIRLVDDSDFPVLLLTESFSWLPNFIGTLLTTFLFWSLYIGVVSPGFSNLSNRDDTLKTGRRFTHTSSSLNYVHTVSVNKCVWKEFMRSFSDKEGESIEYSKK